MAFGIVIAAGGTGGHLYPALAVARELAEIAPGADIVFIGTEHGLESRVLKREGLCFEAVEAGPWRRRRPLTLVTGCLRAAKGAYTASRILGRTAACVVFSTGGYVAAPTLLAAAVRRIPIVLHEPNAVPGVVTRLFSGVAAKVTVGTARAGAGVAGHKLRVTGVPVRRSVTEGSREEARRKFKLEGDTLSIVALGGSQGARTINLAVSAALRGLESSPVPLSLTWIRGVQESDPVPVVGVHPRLAVRIMEYSDDIGPLLRAADLVVARAGASTVAELLAAGVPSILIPYPHAAEDHQRQNARELARAGAAELIEEADLGSNSLADRILALAVDSSRRARMEESARRAARPEAARNVASEILSVAERGMSC